MLVRRLPFLLPLLLSGWMVGAAASEAVLLAQTDVSSEIALEEEVAAGEEVSAEADGELGDEFVDNFDEGFDDDFDDTGGPAPVSDPLETLNRGIFWFNDKLYFYFFKPLAKGFRVLPEGARASVANFFEHWATPARFASALLQAKMNDAGNELGRFVINTTLGIGGLFDAAKEQAGLRRKDEDFGQTLGVYGFGPGIYLMLPIFGPSNVRDGLGRVVDGAMDPLYIHLETGPYWGSRAVEAVNEISLDKDTYEAIKRDALDPYLFVRDAYMQNRAGKVVK